jgi:hypothetical protein
LAEDKEQAVPHKEVMQSLKERIAEKIWTLFGHLWQDRI